MRIRIGLAQVGPTLGNVEENRELLLGEVRRARRRKVDLLVFPELSLTGYFLKDMVPEVALGKGSDFLAEVASLSSGISIVAGFIEESARHDFYNAAGYFEGGKLIHLHRKVYLPTYGLFDERRYVGAGRSVRAFDTRFGRAALLICEDAWHPSLAYVAAQDGAEFLIIPSASPARGVRRGRDGGGLAIQRVWQSLNRSYAGVFNQYSFSPTGSATRTGSTSGAARRSSPPAGSR